MESTGSTAPAAETSLAINGEHNNLPQKSPASSLASSNMVQEMVPEPEATFKCEYCPCTFTTARGRGGHVKAHKHLRQVRQNKIEKERQVRQNKIEKERRRQVRVSSSLPHVPGLRSTAYYFDFHAQLFDSYRTRMHNFPSSARSGVVPLFAGTGGGGHVGSGGHVGTLFQVNQQVTAQYFSWLLSRAVPSFLSQTGSGTSGLAQPSFASPAPAAAGGNGGTGDGVHLRRQQDMPEVNPEETTDGIDLTLRL